MSENERLILGVFKIESSSITDPDPAAEAARKVSAAETVNASRSMMSPKYSLRAKSAR